MPALLTAPTIIRLGPMPAMFTVMPVVPTVEESLVTCNLEDGEMVPTPTLPKGSMRTLSEALVNSPIV